MAIGAHLRETGGPTGNRRELRRTLMMETLGSPESGEQTNVLVHNISTTGLLLESALALGIGEAIEIELPEAGSTRARVVWQSGQLNGCQFDEAISPAALSAAQLRSAVDLSAGLAVGRSESFSERLQRLRKERRLSLADLASELGVSKPTVWAWEQGRSRPLEDRIEHLAKALDVTREELSGGMGTSALGELLARSRGEIAQAAGTSPDRVKIMIEL